METTVCRTTTNIRMTHQRSQRKSFSTEAKSIKLKLDPLFARQIKPKKHKLVLNSKIKLKLKPGNFTKFLTAKKKLELTINDNSTSTASISLKFPLFFCFNLAIISIATINHPLRH